jgi:hypothetical protein
MLKYEDLCTAFGANAIRVTSVLGRLGAPYASDFEHPNLLLTTRRKICVRSKTVSEVYEGV